MNAKMFLCLFVFSFISLLTSPVFALHFSGLGDLPGGSFDSYAYGVSGDGSTVVGRSTSGSGNEAFRWTESGGMQGLGDLQGGSFYSYANGVSGDGSTVEIGRAHV